MAPGSMSPEYYWILGAKTNIHDVCQREHNQIWSGKELTGPTALFNIPTTNSCITVNTIFLCDIITPKDSR